MRLVVNRMHFGVGIDHKKFRVNIQNGKLKDNFRIYKRNYVPVVIVIIIVYIKKPPILCTTILLVNHIILRC